MRERLRTRTAAVVSATAAGAVLASGCGGEDDFKNDPRPPVPVQLTGVITDEKVTVSPRTIKPGPVVLIVSNQTDQAHTIRLQGPSPEDDDEERVDEQVGPVNPGDTGTLQATLERADGGEGYVVRANPGGAVDPEDVIQPARITVSGEKDSSSDELLLP